MRHKNDDVRKKPPGPIRRLFHVLTERKKPELPPHDDLSQHTVCIPPNSIFTRTFPVVGTGTTAPKVQSVLSLVDDGTVPGYNMLNKMAARSSTCIEVSNLSVDESSETTVRLSGTIAENGKKYAFYVHAGNRNGIIDLGIAIFIPDLNLLNTPGICDELSGYLHSVYGGDAKITYNKGMSFGINDLRDLDKTGSAMPEFLQNIIQTIESEFSP
ncbi:hypothetical protein KKB44_03420 [Candidatus Micrarchaeota archaeon]|nr:hypothetical protein [Candidatus Micrarchaeota archaeon]